MDYVFSVRNISRGAFGTRVGGNSFLAVPKGVLSPTPAHRISKRAWFEAVQEAATSHRIDGMPAGDVVLYVHGYNTGQRVMLERLRKLRDGLKAQGFGGVVVAFDWPSADRALSYLGDRRDAKASAIRLVDEGIAAFAARQRADCHINVHVLAHSMGCYVVREAFDDADDRPAVAARSWSVSQVMLVAADVSAASLAEGNPKSSSLYRHSVRLTNYFNPHDEVLSLSNVKRVGVAPRAGRIGLPEPRPQAAVNVYCGRRFLSVRDTPEGAEAASHSWYFDDERFLRDAALTVDGAMDRNELPTRLATTAGNLGLRP